MSNDSTPNGPDATEEHEQLEEEVAREWAPPPTDDDDPVAEGKPDS